MVMAARAAMALQRNAAKRFSSITIMDYLCGTTCVPPRHYGVPFLFLVRCKFLLERDVRHKSVWMWRTRSRGVERRGHRVKVCWVELRDDVELRCSINPAHECLPTWCAASPRKEAKPGVLEMSGERHADELPFKDIRGRHTFQVKDEPGTMRLGSVWLCEHIYPPGEICLFINCPEKSHYILSE